ncbi:MAG: hypothetical protein OCD02_17010 [Spirochaetaceae bacterium]
MTKKVIVIIFLIFTTSIILSSIETNSLFMGKDINCELKTSLNSAKLCCCHTKKTEITLTYTVKIPVVIEYTFEIINHRFTDQPQVNPQRTVQFSSFYSPLENIRLLI